MASGQSAVLRRVGDLFGGATVAGLTERQLLERFVGRRDEVAFEAILTRHGPMVLGLCRRALSDPRDVEDAFQATFLVLVRRAGSIRDRELLAPWLHRVARRVVARIGVEATRRRGRERPGVEDLAGPPSTRDDFAADPRRAIDEELARLPEKYRSPVVLCYLEGRTHQEAADQLRWPVGTVKGRLARARDLLRGRLARRGLAPSAGLFATTMTVQARAVVPEALAKSTLRAATGVAAGRGLVAGLVPATVAALVKGVARTMMISKWKALAASLLALGVVVAGAEVLGRQLGGTSRPGPVGGKSEAKAERSPPVEPSDTSKSSGTDDQPPKVPGGGGGGGDAGNGLKDEARELMAAELDEASIDAELLEMELQSSWQQLQVRLLALNGAEQLQDHPEADQPPPDLKKATERYEELRKFYREKSLVLSKAKRRIRQLMRLLNETEQPQRRPLGVGGGMGGMGSGSGGGFGGGMGGGFG